MNKIDNRYTINEIERKKILHDIGSGIWRMEFIPNQPPRLYGDANMYIMLGAEQEMQPEQLYQHWYGRIEQVYLSYVDKAVERLIKTEQPVEVEYIWNHPQYGKTVVRCDATLSSQKENGETVMLGMHRDVTNKLMNKILQQDGCCVDDYYAMSLCIKYLIKEYEDILLVNIKTKTIHLIAHRKKHCSEFEEGRSVLDIIDKCTSPEEQEKVKKIFSDESIQEIVAKRRSVSVDFKRGANCGCYKWVRGSLSPININGVDELLFVVHDIQNEHKLKMLQEEKEDILNAVIREQSVVYEYDIESQQLRLLKSADQNCSNHVAQARCSLPELADRLCAHYIDASEWSNVKTLLSCENISNSVRDECKQSISIPLDTSELRHDYIKISVFPSQKSKTKAYVLLGRMDKKECLYPILESCIRDTVEYVFYIDLKRGYFFQLISGTEEYEMLPKEGYNYTEEMVRYVNRFVPEEDREFVKKRMSPEFILKKLEHKFEFTFTHNILGAHGEKRKKLVTYKQVDLLRGYVLLQRTDITDMHYREQLLKKAQLEAMTDSLTQLYNRQGSERLIKKAMSETGKGKAAALIVLDLDNFKRVNDKFGHPAGDRVLCEASLKLKKCFRAGDIVGRLGGDEYIVFLKNMLHKSDIHKVLKRVVRELNITCKNETEQVEVTASVGAVFYKGQSYEELYKEADTALYCAKRKKNKYALFDNMK